MRFTHQVTYVWLLCAALLGAIEPSESTGQQAEPPDLEVVLARLEDNMGGLRTVEARFVQEKHLAVFDQTMVVTGMVYLQRPQRFAWKTTEPLRYALVIDGDTIRQWDEETDEIQEVSLDQRPAFGAVVEQMQLWFSGAARALLPDYEARVLQDVPVVLEFIPKEGNFAAQIIRSVRLEFRVDDRYIQRIQMNETGGDSMILTFSDVHINDPIESSAWEVKPRGR